MEESWGTKEFKGCAVEEHLFQVTIIFQEETSNCS